MNATSSTLENRKLLFLHRENFGPAPQFFAAKTGGNATSNLIIKDVPIFRTGTFTDSFGEEMTWEDSHLSQMVQNFDDLKSKMILPDVPIRKGHPPVGMFGPPDGGVIMDGLVGYITATRFAEEVNPSDGLKYHYLFADFEIIDEVAQKKVSSGLWKNLSAELGPTTANNGSITWPTLRGVAYVDFGAVQGLRLHAQHDSAQYSIMMEEGNMTGTVQTPGVQAPAIPALPAPQQFQAPAPGAPAAPAPQPIPSFAFALADGKQSSNFAEVQQFITATLAENSTLREFRDESIKNARETYAKSLITANKYAATQEAELITYAQSLDNAGFDAWKAINDGAPALQLFGQYGQQTNTDPGVQNQQQQVVDATKDRIDVLRGMVSNHALANMPKDKIMKLASYAELKQLDPSFQL